MILRTVAVQKGGVSSGKRSPPFVYALAGSAFVLPEPDRHALRPHLKVGGQRTLRVRRTARGFSLGELMAVVVIMGILATIGIAAIRGHLARAHRTEVHAVMKAIAAAQETYRSEHMHYHQTSLGSLNNIYPMGDPGTDRFAFYGWPSPLGTSWEQLGPEVTIPVTFGYAVVSGLPTSVVSDFPNTKLNTQPAWVATRSPWYVVQAIGDEDGDDVDAVAVMTSFSPSVTWENEGE